MNPGSHNIRFRAELPKAGLPAAFDIVTACNPNGRTVTDKDNQQATATLRSALTADGHFFFPVTCGSPEFSNAEPGFGVLFQSPEEAISWGKQFQQEAVFWIHEGRVQLVPCDGADSVELGPWQSIAEPFAQKPIFHFLGNTHLLNLPKTALSALHQMPWQRHPAYLRSSRPLARRGPLPHQRLPFAHRERVPQHPAARHLACHHLPRPQSPQPPASRLAVTHLAAMTMWQALPMRSGSPTRLMAGSFRKPFARKSKDDG